METQESTGPKRTKDQRLADLAVLSELLSKEKSLTFCVEWFRKNRDYTLSLSALSRDTKALREEWQRVRLQQADIWIGKELAGLAVQEREAWDAWDRSKEQTTRVVIEEIISAKDAEGKTVSRPTKRSVIKESQCGDPAHQNTILGIRDRRARLLGLYAPTKTEHTGPGGAPVGLGVPTITIITKTPPAATWEEQLAQAGVRPRLPG